MQKLGQYGLQINTQKLWISGKKALMLPILTWQLFEKGSANE